MHLYYPQEWLGSAESRIAVIVAHQDDESIAFTDVLRQRPKASVIHVTDGAPEDPQEWRGLATRDMYAALRAQELKAALGAIPHGGYQISLGVIDGTAMHQLPYITKALRKHFTAHGIEFAFTHAFEGGHPDHDATAAAVHIAAKLSGARVIEAPFYRPHDGASLWQTFDSRPGPLPCQVPLDEAGQALKRKMLAAHRSQGGACSKVLPDTEWLREAPAYDFGEPPNGGVLSHLYERAGIDATLWKEISAHAKAIFV